MHTYVPLFSKKSHFHKYHLKCGYKGKDDESLRIFQHLLWLKMRSSYQIFTISGVDNSLSKNLNYIKMKCTLARSMRIKSLRRVVVQICFCLLLCIVLFSFSSRAKGSITPVKQACPRYTPCKRCHSFRGAQYDVRQVSAALLSPQREGC